MKQIILGLLVPVLAFGLAGCATSAKSEKSTATYQDASAQRERLAQHWASRDGSDKNERRFETGR